MSGDILNISFEGLEHLQKMTTPTEYREIGQELVAKGAIYGESRAKEFAPVDRFRLRGSISHQIGQLHSQYGVVGGGKVGTYGLALDKPVTRKPHYRRGPRAGSPTADWFSQTYALTQAKVNELIAAAITRLEGRWRNG